MMAYRLESVVTPTEASMASRTSTNTSECISYQIGEYDSDSECSMPELEDGFDFEVPAETAGAPPVSATHVAPVATSYAVELRHKHARLARYTSASVFAEGVHVLVQADRGLDLGVVVTCTPLASGTPAGAPRGSAGSVSREATKAEVSLYYGELVYDETRCVRFMNKKAREKNIDIAVHSAEFQFDKKKLTFNYTTRQAKPDFRPLLKEGFSIFRCRIWFNNVGPRGAPAQHSSA